MSDKGGDWADSEDHDYLNERLLGRTIREVTTGYVAAIDGQAPFLRLLLDDGHLFEVLADETYDLGLTVQDRE